jgi:hypothetical protein
VITRYLAGVDPNALLAWRSTSASA